MKKIQKSKRVRSAPRIEDKTADFLCKNFKSLNAGAEYILNAAPVLFSQVSRIIEDNFKTEDLHLLKNAMKDFELNYKFAGKTLFLALHDNPKLSKIIENLSPPELFFLEIYLKNIVF